jgi:hypothetical protein
MLSNVLTVGLSAALAVGLWPVTTWAGAKVVISAGGGHGRHHLSGVQHSAPQGHLGFQHHVRQHHHLGFVPPGPRHFGHHPHAPKTIVVTPSAPVHYTTHPSGYWSHHWVPRWHQVPVWVPAGWSADGRWVVGHYETRWVDYGAWHPRWVPY